jgi:hypothetical protein
MIEWGFNGPLIGPLAFVHTTYTHNIKLGFASEIDAKRYFPAQWHGATTPKQALNSQARQAYLPHQKGGVSWSKKPRHA